MTQVVKQEQAADCDISHFGRLATQANQVHQIRRPPFLGAPSH